uniref:Ectoine hydroxylase n=1 Tax=Candidatus Kentrum sp. SD TaxID=2126332 RepID=A0A450YDC7_9GAMM|nr:MAG: ectoine hydroxylase [Candidatus Kentron sp. SD]VFK44756.1 MAG: ectoine hydroxylase [Candidatus Kentron sp. SD]
MLQLTERTEPVVWSEGPHDPLTAWQLDDYARRGYLLIKDVFTTDEVDYLDERVEILADKRPENAIFGSEGEGHLRFLFGIHNDEPFKKYVRDRFIVGAARQILGAEDLYIYQSKMVSKVPFIGQEIPFHTDYDVWRRIDGLPSPRITNVGIFLTDQEMFNGALMVVPGSHKYFLEVSRHRPDTDQVHGDGENFDYIADLRRRRCDQIDREKFRMIAEQNGFDYLTGPKGSVLFFDANIIHGSTDNISPFPRRQLFLTYNHIANKPGNPARPHFMVDRDYEIIR